MYRCFFILFDKVIPAGDVSDPDIIRALMTGFEKNPTSVRETSKGARAEFTPLKSLLKLKENLRVMVEKHEDQLKRLLTFQEINFIARHMISDKMAKSNEVSRHVWTEIVTNDYNLEDVRFAIEAPGMTPDELDELFSVGITA